ncbi:AMP-binding protein, partial [Nocardia cyriacigeorgica]|uniref:AMP-binding protein n=1 Tax=Nocardia cyriacigeorgica TaxID=135487 RepID=UPI002453A5EF
MGIDPNARVRELLECYDRADASAAWLLCDRHPADAVAFTVIDSDLSSTDLTYGQLRAKSERFAAALARLGVEPGDRVATLMAKSEDLVVALLGIWRRGAVHVPLFTAFAPPAIAFRLAASGASIVITDPDQASKLAPGDDIPADPPWRVIVTGDDPAPDKLRMRDLMTAPPAGGPRGAGGGGRRGGQILNHAPTPPPEGVARPGAAQG